MVASYFHQQHRNEAWKEMIKAIKILDKNVCWKCFQPNIYIQLIFNPLWMWNEEHFPWRQISPVDLHCVLPFSGHGPQNRHNMQAKEYRREEKPRRQQIQEKREKKNPGRPICSPVVQNKRAKFKMTLKVWLRKVKGSGPAVTHEHQWTPAFTKQSPKVTAYRWEWKGD